MAIEAARRFSRTTPMLLSRYLFYWGELTKAGREDLAVAEIERMESQVREHPAVLHFCGQTAAQLGDFDKARGLYHRALSSGGSAPLIWFALSAVSNFKDSPELFDAMLTASRHMGSADANAGSRFQYALGRAYHDLGEFEAAMRHYTAGADLRRKGERYERAQMEAFVERLVRDFTPENMAKLKPPQRPHKRAIFVNGLPRSGTTLTEQVLTAHDAVSDGGEVNLLAPALIPTLGQTLEGAFAYQASGEPDPWGRVAATYSRLMDMRFGANTLVVDKTLLHSHQMGFILHALPRCPIVWLRRDAADVALSCFRNYFSSPMTWSWSLADIGHFMRLEDRLFAHWQEHFGEQIMVVQYEEFVANPTATIDRLLVHAGLPPQPGLDQAHLSKRKVRTASMVQVRQPIVTGRIGLSRRYERWMGEFYQTYEGR